MLLEHGDRRGRRPARVSQSGATCGVAAKDDRLKLSDALAFALKFERRERKHDADEKMAKIAAACVVRYLARARYVVMKRPPLGGHSTGRGFEG